MPPIPAMKDRSHTCWFAMLSGIFLPIFFAVPSPAEAAFRFVVWGDATDLIEHVVTNAAQIRQLSVPPDLNLFAGDLYDTGFSPAAAEALKSSMDSGSGTALSGTLFPVRGNHDII